MAEVQFAAGATQVTPAHMAARPCTSLAEVKAALATLPRKPVLALLFTAHLMGGRSESRRSRGHADSS